MKKLILLLISAFLLAGFVYMIGDSKTKKEGSDLFSKKQECQEYIDEIENKLQEEEDKIRAEDIAMSSGVYAEYKLDKVFYSSSRNSCLYVYVFEAFNNNNSLFYRSLELVDYLTGETLELASTSPSSDDYWTFKDNFYINLVSRYE